MVKNRFLTFKTYKIYVKACIKVKIVGRVFLCNGGKMKESEGSNCFFHHFLCVRIEIEQL